jgi:glycosyltransferase involved in cell wall biosynthesis
VRVPFVVRARLSRHLFEACSQTDHQAISEHVVRILYINHYAGSPSHGMEYRPYYLAREWVRAGHHVRMLAASFSHVRSQQPSVGTVALNESIDGIDYTWFPTPHYQGNGLGRVRNIASFLWQVWSGTPKLVKDFKPDVVIASSTYPMDIWVARRIARKSGAKLVFEVHDLWPLSPIELSGMSPGHPFIRVCQAAEDTAYRDADLVVSMLPKVADHMAAHGLDLQKLCIVPNGISPEEWEGTTEPLADEVADYIAEQRRLGRTVVGYAGSHGTPNALDTLVEAAALLRDADIAIVLVGDGHEKQALLDRVSRVGLQKLKMFPPIPKRQIPTFLSLIDIAYIGWQRVPIYRFGIAPNKLMDYMMAGCAVLHSVEAGNDPVAEAGCGLTVAPTDAKAVADGLLSLAGLSSAQRTDIGRRGREYVRQYHLYPVLADRFLAAVQLSATASHRRLERSTS